MAKSIKKNYIYNLVYQILLVFSPLITTPYISRVLGASGVGEISFIESIVSYFVLFATLGITTFGQREISYYQEDIKTRSIVFFNVLIFKFIVAFSVLLIYLLLCVFCFKTNIYYIFAINILTVFFDITWFFQGIEEFKLIATRNTIFKILSIVFIFVFVKESKDILKYAFAVTFFTLLANISLILYLKGEIKKVSFSDLNPFKDVKVIFSLFLPTIAIQIYTVLDKTMIGIITHDSAENGYYEQAMKLSKFLLIVVTSLSTVIIPRIGHFYSKRDHESLKSLLYKSYRFVMLIAIPLTFGLFLISDSFVPWFLGAEFIPSIALIKVLAFLIIAIGLSNVTGIQYMVPTSKQNLLTLSVCFGAVINIALNTFLISKYKSFGAAIASLIAETAITIIQFILVRGEISFTYIFMKSKNYLFAGIIMFISISILSLHLSTGIYGIMIRVFTGALIYFVILFIVKDAYFIELFDNFLEFIHISKGKKS